MPEELQDAFARIEGAVAGGRTDLGELGFWRLTRQIKRDPRLAAHWAEVAGRIDRRAWERRHRFRLPLWLGLAILLGETVVAAALVPIAVAIAEGDRGRAFSVVGVEISLTTLAGILLLVAAGALAVGVHGPAHWVAGRLGGMRFLGWFLGGPLRIPGLKVEYASYLRSSARSRAMMHATGALATKAAPFAVFAPAYVRHARAGWELLPEWSLWGLLAMGAVMILTDVLWSTKHSDWKKVRRELQVARAMERGPVYSKRDPGSSGQPG